MDEFKSIIINFNNLFSLLPIHIYFLDKNGVYQACNDLQALDFGLNDKEEIVGKKNIDLPVFNDYPEIITILENNNQKVITSKKTMEFEEPLPRRNKKLGVCKSYKMPVFGKDNLVIGLVGLSFDVSEERETFQKLDLRFKNTELALNNIMANLPGHVYWLDKNNNFLGCNDEQAHDFGLKHNSDIVGLHVSSFQTQKNAEVIIENNKKILETGCTLSSEELFVNQKGEKIFYLSKKIPLKDKNNHISGILGISIDITERKKMEVNLRQAKLVAEAASQAKSDFIANISHDLRTPLTGIVTMSESLKDRLIQIEGEEEAEQEAEWLHDSGEQLLEFCNNILDSVAAENYTELDVKEDCFDLRQLIEAIFQLEMPMIKSKELDFFVRVDANIPPYLIMDKSKLYQILLNLIGNAIKFTEKGQIGIEVRLMEQNDENVNLKFCIIDTGIGIKPELQEQIFNRFFRINPSYKGTYKGSGLGLYIAEKYVQLLGGDHIKVESEEGKGCRFFFILPFKIGEKKNAIQILPQQPRKLKSIPSKIKTLKSKDDSIPSNAPFLLLIEDNKPALRGLEAMVKKAGCRFKSAEDGETGLELAKTNDFDLIISDIGLPGISGIEATKAIRAWEKENNRKRVPIVALTGHAAQMAEPECLQAGMNQVLTKPASLGKIQELIHQFIVKNERVDFRNNNKLKTGLGPDLPDTEEELFMLDQYLYFDRKLMQEIYGDNWELLANEFLEDILKQIPKDKEELEQAYKAKDWYQVEQLAHKVKGGAACCGVLRMKYACQYLERYLRAGHSKLLEKLYQQLVDVLDETKEFLDEWLRKNAVK